MKQISTSSDFVWVAPPIIKVSCEDGIPVADPDPLTVNTHARQPTLIVWQGDNTIDEITDIEFKSPTDEFSDPVRRGPKTWTVIDKCTTGPPGSPPTTPGPVVPYEYSITAICKGSDKEVTNDPVINNQDLGG